MMVRRFNCLGHAQRIYTPLRRPHSLRPCSRDPPSHLRVITEWHAVTCVLDQNAKVEPSYDVGPVQLDDESDEHARGDDAALLLRLEHAVTLVDENALALGDDWLLELA